MTRKRRRLYALGLIMLGIGAAVTLVLTAFEDNIVFFYSPSDLQAMELGDRRFRLGGLVEQGSLRKLADGTTVEFLVTDTAHTLPVRYTGLLPDLFREGQGVVAEGQLEADGVFIATEVLAKHDENYMPPEVAEALERAGHFMADRPEDEASAAP